LIAAPKDVSPAIRELAPSDGGEHAEPNFVESEPVHGAALDCFPIVDHVVVDHGGEAIYGWRVWENPCFVEAEFHCVWWR
jgi:hypothetical protein